MMRQKQIEAKTNCRDPGLNQGPSDLQSDALPTELSRLHFVSATNLWAWCMFYVVYLCATTSDVVVTIEVYLLVLLVLSILHVECSDRRHAGGLFFSFQLHFFLYGAVS